MCVSCWNAGRIRDAEYEQNYTTNYLFGDPESFIHTHFPCDPEWQLLDPALSEERFSRTPYIRAEFFGHGLSLVTPLERVNRSGLTAEFELLVPRGISVHARVLNRDGERVGDAVRGSADQGRVSFGVRFPEPGEWVVALYAKRGSPYGRHNGVARFGFVSER